jgi:predicted RNA-binding protein with PUA-like domain
MSDTTHWLLKTEPETYSFEQLQKEGKTHWNGVRNHQARNYLNQIKPGDLALIYHSGKNPEVVGIAEVTRSAYPDPDPERPGDWVQIDLEPVKALKIPVSLKVLKSTASLKSLPLIKQSRLSVMPITSSHYKTILKLGGIQL